MQIVTKREADKILVASLFNAGGTLSVMRFDGGKYKGKPSDYVGREVSASADVKAIYPHAGRDSDGPYVALSCIYSAR